jgi:hypothetical protein
MKGAAVRHQLMQLSQRRESLEYRLARSSSANVSMRQNNGEDMKTRRLRVQLRQVAMEQRFLKDLLANAWIDAVARLNNVHPEEISLSSF